MEPPKSIYIFFRIIFAHLTNLFWTIYPPPQIQRQRTYNVRWIAVSLALSRVKAKVNAFFVSSTQSNDHFYHIFRCNQWLRESALNQDDCIDNKTLSLFFLIQFARLSTSIGKMLSWVRLQQEMAMFVFFLNSSFFPTTTNLFYQFFTFAQQNCFSLWILELYPLVVQEYHV